MTSPIPTGGTDWPSFVNRIAGSSDRSEPSHGLAPTAGSVTKSQSLRLGIPTGRSASLNCRFFLAVCIGRVFAGPKASVPLPALSGRAHAGGEPRAGKAIPMRISLSHAAVAWAAWCWPTACGGGGGSSAAAPGSPATNAPATNAPSATPAPVAGTPSVAGCRVFPRRQPVERRRLGAPDRSELRRPTWPG